MNKGHQKIIKHSVLFQREGIECAKALRQEKAWPVSRSESQEV